jgi:TolA-binding protein
MPRTLPCLTLSIALLAGAGAVHAQTAQTTQPAPAGQPPATERIEPGSDEPATKIEPRRGTQIREKRNNGQVTEVEVQSGKSHYVLRPNQPAGNAQPGDAQSGTRGGPQWQVLEFDLNGKKKAAADAEAAAAAAGTTAPGAAQASATGAPPKVPAATVPMTKPADIPPPPPLPATR